LPDEVRASVAWFEVGVYPSGQCPSIAQLSGGLPRGGLVGRVAFASGAASPHMKLDKGSYAFAAAARNTQCETLAAGCTSIEVPGKSEIAIELKSSPSKGGRCPAGSSCRHAECLVSPTDTSGDACSLEVLGAGPLDAFAGEPLGVVRPAIAAVSDGFVIAFAQYGGPDSSKVVTLKVGPDGSPVAAAGISLPYYRYDAGAACASDAETGGLGLSFPSLDALEGLLVVPRSPACTKTTLEVWRVAPNAQRISEGPFEDAVQTSQVLSNHALALGGYFARVLDDRAVLSTLGPEGIVAGSTVDVGGAPPHALTWVAASSEGIGVITQTKGAPAPAPDAGDTGDEPELRLEVATLQPQSAFSPVTPSLRGRFASIAIDRRRLAIVSSGPLSAPIQYSLLDIGDTTLRTASVETLVSTGTALGADVAVSNDRMFIGAVLSTGISVAAFDAFSSTPKLHKQVALEKSSRVKPFLGGVFDQLRDGYISLAAANGRIGVAWITGQRIDLGEELGGWAVLACR
jgi:hypothetical protein